MAASQLDNKIGLQQLLLTSYLDYSISIRKNMDYIFRNLPLQ